MSSFNMVADSGCSRGSGSSFRLGLGLGLGLNSLLFISLGLMTGLLIPSRSLGVCLRSLTCLIYFLLPKSAGSAFLKRSLSELAYE